MECDITRLNPLHLGSTDFWERCQDVQLDRERVLSTGGVGSVSPPGTSHSAKTMPKLKTKLKPYFTIYTKIK